MKKVIAVTLIIIGGVAAWVFINEKIASFKAYSAQNKKTFTIAQKGDPALIARANAVLPKIIAACPGLDRYADDLSPAEVSASQQADPLYHGGLELKLKVTDRPQVLPGVLKGFSMSHNCFLDISLDGKMMSIAKRPCHSICAGKLQENDPPDSGGREFILR